MKQLMLVLILAVMFTAINVQASDQEHNDTQNIVVFHSYHDGLGWTDELHSGIVDGIDVGNVEVFVEYMDSYRTSGEEHRQLLLQYYSEKYATMEIAVVVVADNYAFDFMSEYYEEIFDGIPMVFGGVNDFHGEDLFYEHSTGLAQTASQRETIELIKMLHPETKQIVFIGGNNLTALSEANAVMETASKMEIDVDFDSLISDNLNEQIEALIDYDNDTVLIAAGTIRNASGEFFDHAQYCDAIMDSTGLPVYAMASVYLGDEGAIGGYVVDAYNHGSVMGDYVTRLLTGESISALPIIEKPESVYRFDYYRLREFGISKDALPEGSVIMNAPIDSFEINRIYVILYIGIAVFLLLVIIIMTINIRRRINAEVELSKQNDILQHMAYHDSTTNLYNRKYLVDYLQNHLLEKEHQFTALYDLDVCNLKMINDTYGYEVGNKVLKHVASILKKSFKSPKECVGTYHSEFLIIDSEVISKENAVSKAGHLVDVIQRTIELDYMEIDIKVNVGIALAPMHTLDSRQLLKKANIALVESIKMGPGIVRLFEDTLYRDILKRITLEKQLRRAISLDELVLYYQPRIDIKRMKVIGCEALIRWNHPDGMLVFPNDFIPLAEEVGLIEDIGQWVVKESAKQAKKWYEEGYNIKISLNVSGREFDDDFVRNLQKVIEGIDVNPRLLELEITETAALKDIEHSRTLVQMLHSIGLSVSLDDFGTGYSSMTYIKQLKASKLKIDKSFIDDLANYEQKVVVDSMIQLGKKLDYIINIEGVETEEQLKILKYLGVDEVQGWLFSKAIPAEAFIEYAKSFEENWA